MGRRKRNNKTWKERSLPYVICSYCDDKIDVGNLTGSKTELFKYMRTQGWSIGRGYRCPECKGKHLHHSI